MSRITQPTSPNTRIIQRSNECWRNCQPKFTRWNTGRIAGTAFLCACYLFFPAWLNSTPDWTTVCLLIIIMLIELLSINILRILGSTAWTYLLSLIVWVLKIHVITCVQLSSRACNCMGAKMSWILTVHLHPHIISPCTMLPMQTLHVQGRSGNETTCTSIPMHAQYNYAVHCI